MKINIKRPLVVFAAGLILVGASSVGATRAAVKLQDDLNQVDFNSSKLTVSVLEERDGEYVTASDGQLQFTNLQEDFHIGQKYTENVKILNNSPGGYDEYVRASVRKSWVIDGVKDTNLNPDAIVLGFADGWIETDKTDEGAIYYYDSPIKANDEEHDYSVPLITSVKVDNLVWDYVKTEAVNDDKTVVRNSYSYGEHTMVVELKVDAIQAHNGAEAMRGAWGVKAVIDENGKITKVNGSSKYAE